MSQRESQERLRSMVFCAMLVAISVLLTRFVTIQVSDAVRIGFGTVPIMLAGIVCGPVYGLIVGLLADFIGCFVNLMGASIIPGLILCSGLMGVVPAVLLRHAFKKESVVLLAVSVAVAELLVSALLKSWFLMDLYGGPYMVWLGQKTLNAVVMTVIEVPVLKLLLGLVKKYRR